MQTLPPGYKIIHDEDHAEDVRGNTYLIAKCYGPDDSEVGHVKLEIAPPVTEGEAPSIRVTASGGLRIVGDASTRISIEEDNGHSKAK